jgi:hypothetical protein
VRDCPLLNFDPRERGSPHESSMNPHRANIINTLQLISSPTAALEYQRQVPAVKVAAELANQWFGDFYHPGSPQFDSAFTVAELEELARFHRSFDAKVDALPGELQALLSSLVWSQVSSEAGAVLDRLNWVGLGANYGDRAA